MDSAVTLNVSPLQMLLSVVLQLWLIIFPILILKKLNYLTELLEEKFGLNQDAADDSEAP